MRAEDSPEYLLSVADAVTEFRAAVVSFLELHVFNESMARGIAPAVFPKDGADAAEISRRMAAASLAAGKAADAPRLTGVLVGVQGVGTVDPIAAWASMARPKPLLEPDDVLGACDQILGRLHGLILKAKFVHQPTSGSRIQDDLVSPEKETALTATADTQRPRVFIGSSSEGLEVAKSLQVLLDRSCEVEIWTQGLFEPGGSTLQSLANAAAQFDFAILVVSPDDTTVSRGQEKNTTRDNVIFELGLFMGALGHARTFMVYDRTQRPDLPSDLAGVTPATFEPHRGGNLDAALGPATTVIERSIRKLGHIDRGVARDEQSSALTLPAVRAIMQELAVSLVGSRVAEPGLDHVITRAAPKEVRPNGRPYGYYRIGYFHLHRGQVNRTRDTVVILTTEDTTVGQFLDEIWFVSQDLVAPYTFNRNWHLEESDKGDHWQVLHATSHSKETPDNRNLAEVMSADQVSTRSLDFVLGMKVTGDPD